MKNVSMAAQCMITAPTGYVLASKE